MSSGFTCAEAAVIQGFDLGLIHADTSPVDLPNHTRAVSTFLYNQALDIISPESGGKPRRGLKYQVMHLQISHVRF